MTVQFLEQLWPLGCMSVSAAPEQMCQPKSMNFVRKMYVGTRIPSVEPHGLARGFSQLKSGLPAAERACGEKCGCAGKYKGRRFAVWRGRCLARMDAGRLDLLENGQVRSGVDGRALCGLV